MAVQLIAQSFADDPGIVFFSPNPAKRRLHTLKLINAISGILEKFGEKYIILHKNRVIAVTMSIPPGRQISVLSMIQSGFLFIPFFLGLRTFNKVMKFIDFSWKLREDHMAGREYWHLFYLAVHPEYRRKGYGKLILSNILDHAAKDKKPVFLQTFTEEGIKFFKKNSFKTVSETIFSEKCTMRCMIRDFSISSQKTKNPERKEKKKSLNRKPAKKTNKAKK